MLTLPSTPEIERRLQEEAAKRGLQAPEYALLLIEGFLKPDNASDVQEQVRLAAIDELLGVAADSSFSTVELLRERKKDRDTEEERYRRRFGRQA